VLGEAGQRPAETLRHSCECTIEHDIASRRTGSTEIMLP
jgi:hypothetical protein